MSYFKYLFFKNNIINILKKFKYFLNSSLIEIIYKKYLFNIYIENRK